MRCTDYNGYNHRASGFPSRLKKAVRNKQLKNQEGRVIVRIKAGFLPVTYVYFSSGQPTAITAYTLSSSGSLIASQIFLSLFIALTANPTRQVPSPRE